VQIGGAMGQLSRATQQNAAASEELAATSDALSDQAQQLQESVAFFKIDGSPMPKGLALTQERRSIAPASARPNMAPLAAPRPHQEGAEQARLDVSGLDVDRVIAAHAQWKTKFRAAISRQETMDAATIARDDCCELGKWLYGPVKGRLGKHPRFVELLKEHQGFHREAGQVATAINEKAFSQAEQMIGHGSAFAEASTLVTNALSAIKRA